jgi:hypothetical protein
MRIVWWKGAKQASGLHKTPCVLRARAAICTLRTMPTTIMQQTCEGWRYTTPARQYLPLASSAKSLAATLCSYHACDLNSRLPTLHQRLQHSFLCCCCCCCYPCMGDIKGLTQWVQSLRSPRCRARHNFVAALCQIARGKNQH